MIVLIDTSIDYLEKLEEITVSAIIHGIVDISRRGHHLIIVNREISRFFLSRSVDILHHAVLSNIANRYTQVGNLAYSADVLARVTDSDNTIPGRKEIRISFSEFIEGAIASSVILLVENQRRDGYLMEFILEQFARRKSFPNLSISVVNGGGSDISSQAELIRERDVVFVAAVDSDAKSPHDKKSPSIDKLEKILLDYEKAELFVLPVHEIENLLTQAELSILPQWISMLTKDFYLKIETRRDKGTCEFYRFIDYKMGMNLAKIESLPENSHREWLGKKMKEYGVMEYAGMGEGIVETFLKSNEAKSAFATTIFSAKWQSDFGPFFSYMVQWFVADTKFRF